MKVYVFGNPDYSEDDKALKIADKLALNFDDIDFVIVKPNEDVPFVGEDPVFIIDVVEGIKKVELIPDDMLDKLVVGSSSTVHDYDLGFQIRYLKKLGKLGKVFILGIPKDNSVSYRSVQSIFKKLVAQDIQGS